MRLQTGMLGLAGALALGCAPGCRPKQSREHRVVPRPDPPPPRPTTEHQGLTFPVDPPSPTALRAVPAFARLDFDRPVFLTHAPGDPERVFVVEQAGRIVAFDAEPDATRTEVFLDIRGRVRMRHNEEGLLGLAFAPDYQRSGRFYLYYSASSPRRTQLSRFTAEEGVGDADSEEVLLQIRQPYGNHNGGMIAFGPDEMLYVAVGDGGLAGDPERAGQDLGTHLAKILRIDVAGAGPGYRVPSDNPFVDAAGARPEIWAYGLRNPWRFSFDRSRGTLWVGDVGQNALEEIDIVVRGGNYGWNAREGSRPYSSADARDALDPVVEYGRGEGESVTGGYVYRGTQLPAWRGAYFYGDYATGTVWALVHDGERVVSNDIVARVPSLSSFGEDAAGELYALSLAGTVYRLDPADEIEAESSRGFPTLLSQTGVFEDLETLAPNPTLLGYSVRAPLWSDGADKRRWLSIPQGETIGFARDGAWTFPVGTVTVKHFERGGERIETRVMVHERYGWSGYTYRWNEGQTDATLVGAPHVTRAGGGPWAQPAGSDCLRCHTATYGEALGLRTRQLDARTLADWNARGLFEPALPDPDTLPRHPDVSDASVSATQRARAYLDSNCAPCHHPGGPAPGDLDLRATTSLPATHLLAAAEEPIGLEHERRLVPADTEHSALYVRMGRRDEHGMPPLASLTVDEHGRELVRAWIESLPGTE